MEPEEIEEEPNDDPKDNNVRLSADADLPWPNPDLGEKRDASHFFRSFTDKRGTAERRLPVYQID